MYTYEFTKQAFRDIKKLPKDIQKRIVEKLNFYCSQKNPLSFADHLINFEIGSYRFRIGGYRVIFDTEKTRIIILTLGHRREIYR